VRYPALPYVPGSGVDFDAVANAGLLDPSLNRHALVKQQGIRYTVVPTPTATVMFENK
jgi:hypothetical protein